VRRLMTMMLVLALAVAGRDSVPAAEPKAPQGETRYLTFQVQAGIDGFGGPRPEPGRVSLSKAQIEEFVHSVTKAIGTTGDARNKLAFAIGPLCFDMPDDETRQFIRDAFAVARETDVAVALHIDDSMKWGVRKDLISNPANIETADWKQVPSTGRRMDWGSKPTKFAPQMCFNAPAIIAAVKDRGALIGREVKKEMNALKAAGKEYLFAGLIAGWETRIGRDFDTDRPLGYRALSYRGFSESKPPQDADHERVLVVKEFIELWASALHAPGVPREKIYCHIAFTAQGLDHKEKTQTVSTFALPEVAFSTAYRPGFSTYPDGSAFKEIWGHVAAHDSPAWISAEGTNVSPSGMSSGISMETYLGRHFNHGAVMVNLFAWGMGGEAMRHNFFRRAAEDPEPLAAYGKFLRGDKLVESAATGFSSEALEAKMRRIQTELPVWVQKSGKQAQAMPLVQKMQALIKDKKWQEVDKVADELLDLIKGEKPKNGKQGAGAAHLRFFGYAGVDSGLRDPHVGGDKTNYLDEVADFCNIAGLNVYDPAESAAARLDAMSNAGVSAGLDVQAIFFERVNPPVKKTGSKTEYRLRADYKARWDQFRKTSVLDARLASIACFYIADEPVWNGITAKDLATQADLIKATYPSVPLLVIEAPPSINDLVVPKSVDWIGFDRFGTVDPGSDKRYLQNLRDLKSRRTTSEQKIVIVFEAQWMPDYGKAGYQKEAMAELAGRYYRLASSDPDVIGLVGFAWPGGLGGPDRYGARNLPESVKAEHRRIGLTITEKPASNGK